MTPPTEHDPTDAISPLEALLELPRSAGEDTLEDFLVTVADTVCRSAGFSSVVINLYRPAWDDYEAMLVIGGGSEELLGATAESGRFRRIFGEADQPLPGVFFLTEESGFWNDLPHVYTPQVEPTDTPNAWRAGDGLLVFLSDPSGAPLAMFSMDEPLSGLRPSDDELLDLATRTIVPELGFERCAAYTAEGSELVLRASAGWEERGGLPESLEIAEIEPLIEPVREQAGCFLGRASELFGDHVHGDGERSRRNGRGTTAWSDHCLLVPCRSGDGTLRGLIVIEDPLDRLLPSADRRRAVRLLVDQVAAALQSTEGSEDPSDP